MNAPVAEFNSYREHFIYNLLIREKKQRTPNSNGGEDRNNNKE